MITMDLGKDVPPETIVETAVEKHIELVGLSALMTTTVPSMEETIVQLRKGSTVGKGDGWRCRADPGICRYHGSRPVLPRCHGFRKLRGSRYSVLQNSKKFL